MTPKPFFPKGRLVPQRSPKMTIALGMRCMDGMVLCTDSLELDGISKRFVNKLWVYEVQHLGQQEWGIAIASAGDGDLADSFNDGLKDVLGNCDFDEVKLMALLRAAIREVRISYPEAEFGFIASIYGNPKLYSKMFRVMDRSSHFGPVTRYQAIGVGGGLANYLLSQFYSLSITVKEATRLGVFILQQVKASTEGCDGPTSVVTCGGLGEIPQFKTLGQDEIGAIETEISSAKFRTALEGFWREHNPNPTFTPMHPKEGGSAHRTITLKLNSMPMPSVPRKSKDRQ
jgi:hypothetical protein